MFDAYIFRQKCLWLSSYTGLYWRGLWWQRSRICSSSVCSRSRCYWSCTASVSMVTPCLSSIVSTVLSSSAASLKLCSPTRVWCRPSASASCAVPGSCVSSRPHGQCCTPVSPVCPRLTGSDGQKLTEKLLTNSSTNGENNRRKWAAEPPRQPRSAVNSESLK